MDKKPIIKKCEHHINNGLWDICKKYTEINPHYMYGVQLCNKENCKKIKRK